MPKRVPIQNDDDDDDAKNNQCNDEKTALQIVGTKVETAYQRRPRFCILDGDTEFGGLLILIPVLGLTIGIAERTRAATG